MATSRVDHADQVRPIAVPFLDLRRLHSEIEDEIVESWRSILRSASFVGGEAVEAYEAQMATYLDVPEVVGVANGTDAIVIALLALGIERGDEVIVPANTFVATVEAVIHAGGVPVLVDVDPYTANIDPHQVEIAVSPQTRFIVPVHLYGQAAPMATIMDIASRHGLKVVEDNAQSIGATHRGARTGSFGDAAAMSFYPGKNLGATGDGGAIAFQDPGAAARARTLSNHGRDPSGEHVVLGYNSRLDAIHAAVLTIKLRKLDGWNARRRQLALTYEEHLGDLELDLPLTHPDNEHIYHLYVVRSSERDLLAQDLKSQGVMTGLHYPRPVHLCAPYAHLGDPGDFPVAESWARRLLSLPMCPTFSPDDIVWVATAIRRAMEGRDAVAD